MTIKPEILDFAKQYDLARSWLNLLSAQVEVSQAERRLQELKSEISTLDRLNVFTDTREEAEEKDCKQRVQSRQKDVVRHAKDVAGALKELCAQDPEFGLALELEGHLRQSLQVESAAEAKKLGGKIEQWVDALTKGHQNWQGDDTPAELVGPYRNLGTAALTLAAALLNSTEGVERRWESSVRVLQTKPLLKRLAHKCRISLDTDAPGTPLPGFLLATLRGDPASRQEASDSPLTSLSEQQLEPGFEALERTSREIAHLRLTVKLNRSKISTLDRINVFTDSEAEAREKRLKAAVKSLQTRFQSELESLLNSHSRMRAELWPTWILDLGHDLHGKVSSIGVSDPSGFFTKTAEILNREAPALAAHNFLQAMDKRFPGTPALERLQSVISHWGEAAPIQVAPIEHFPMPPQLEEKEIAALFHLALQSKGYTSSRQAIQDAEHRLENLQGEISRQSAGQKALGMLSLLVARVGDNSWRERKATEEYLHQARREAEESVLLALWEGYAPCALGHLLSELTTRIASITAVVHSRTVEDSEGNTSTEYYSVAQGKTEAVETSLTIRRLLEKSSSKYPFPQQWLEEYTENQTSREIAAQPLVL